MKKRMLSIFLAMLFLLTPVVKRSDPVKAVVLSNTIPSVTPALMRDELPLTASPYFLNEMDISSFTADFDYNIKQDSTLSLYYDAQYGFEEIYSCDYNNGETVNIASGAGVIENSDNKLLITGKNSVKTENFATELYDLDICFDTEVKHTWTNAKLYLRGGQLILNIRGDTAAGSAKRYLMLSNNTTGDSVTYTESVSGKRVRILAVGKNVYVYVNGERVIDYTYSDDCTVQGGNVYFTATECPIAVDNFSVWGSSTETSGYFKLDIGESTSLSYVSEKSEKSIATGENLIKAKSYRITVKRNKGKLTLSADGETILSADTAYPYENAFCGDIGFSSTLLDDRILNLKIYNTSHITVYDGYAAAETVQTGAASSLTAATQNGSSDAAVSISDNGFSVSSPTSLNAYMTTTEILNSDQSDVYIKFNIKGSRPDWTYDNIYFGGYDIRFNANEKTSPNLCTAYSPTGEEIACNSTYSYFSHSLYTVELIKSGKTVAVYYYPKDTERTLLFTDNRSNTPTTNLTLRRQQGTVFITDFTVLGTDDINELPNVGLISGSAYKKVKGGITLVPLNTTVAQFKSNLLNSELVSITKNGRPLTDRDIISTGSILTYDGYPFKWTVGTLYDLNGDKEIDLRDLYILDSYLKTGTHNLTDTQIAGADVNLDGKIDLNDTALIRQAALKITGTVGEISFAGLNTTPFAPLPEIENAYNTGDEITLSVDLRNYLNRGGKRISAIQTDIIWNGEDAEYVKDSFFDKVKADTHNIGIGSDNIGGISVIYEPENTGALLPDSLKGMFTFKIKIKDTTKAANIFSAVSKLVLVYEDGETEEQLNLSYKAFTVIQKGINRGQDLAAPLLKKRTSSTVTLNGTKGAEYSLDKINWQESCEFSGLKYGNTYSFYQRIKETEDMYVGEISKALTETLYLEGDLDRNTLVNSVDLTLLAKRLLGKDISSDIYAADVNTDDQINIADLVHLKKILAE